MDHCSCPITQVPLVAVEPPKPPIPIDEHNIPKQLSAAMTQTMIIQSKGATVGFRLTWPLMTPKEEKETDETIWEFTKKLGAGHIAFAAVDFDGEGKLTYYQLVHMGVKWKIMDPKMKKGEERYTIEGEPLYTKLDVHPNRVFQKVEPMGLVDRATYPTNAAIEELGL